MTFGKDDGGSIATIIRSYQAKAKPVVRQGRKATGFMNKETAGLPWESRQLGCLLYSGINFHKSRFIGFPRFRSTAGSAAGAAGEEKGEKR